MVINYMEQSHILFATITGCVSNSAFASLIASSPIRSNLCAITVGIKNYNSIIKRKKKSHNKIVLLQKTKLNTIGVLISEALIDSYISHNER